MGVIIDCGRNEVKTVGEGFMKNLFRQVSRDVMIAKGGALAA